MIRQITTFIFLFSSALNSFAFSYDYGHLYENFEAPKFNASKWTFYKELKYSSSGGYDGSACVRLNFNSGNSLLGSYVRTPKFRIGPDNLTGGHFTFMSKVNGAASSQTVEYKCEIYKKNTTTGQWQFTSFLINTINSTDIWEREIVSVPNLVAGDSIYIDIIYLSRSSVDIDNWYIDLLRVQKNFGTAEPFVNIDSIKVFTNTLVRFYYSMDCVGRNTKSNFFIGKSSGNFYDSVALSSFQNYFGIRSFQFDYKYISPNTQYNVRIGAYNPSFGTKVMDTTFNSLASASYPLPTVTLIEATNIDPKGQIRIKYKVNRSQIPGTISYRGIYREIDSISRFETTEKNLLGMDSIFEISYVSNYPPKRTLKCFAAVISDSSGSAFSTDTNMYLYPYKPTVSPLTITFPTSQQIRTTSGISSGYDTVCAILRYGIDTTYSKNYKMLKGGLTSQNFNPCNLVNTDNNSSYSYYNTMGLTSNDISEFRYNKLYYFRVEATNGAGTAYIDTFYKTKTLSNFLPPVVNCTPNVGSTSANLNISLSTNNSGDNGLTDIDIEYGLTTAYGFKVNNFPKRNLMSTNPIALQGTLSGLLPKTTYYYKISADNAGGDVLLTGTFKTNPATGINDELKSDLFSIVFPNPVSSSLNVRLFSSKVISMSDINFTLSDINGKQVKLEVNNFKSNSNEYSFNVDISDLPLGIYFYEITSGVSVSRNRVAIMR